MDIRISARFWSIHDDIPDVTFFDGRQLLIRKQLPVRKRETGEFYAASGEFKASSTSEALNIVAQIYEIIAAQPNLIKVVNSDTGYGEVWVVSFGDDCKMEGNMPTSLQQLIQKVGVSLYAENYPISGDNPQGKYIYDFSRP